MTDIPRWPKISLLDDPDEEERAKRQLNESRRKRGLEPLYPEAGFPDVPGLIDTLFGGGKPLPLGGYRDEPSDPEKPGPVPMPLIDPRNIKDGTSGGAGRQIAQAEPPKSADIEEPPSRTNSGSNPSGQADMVEGSQPKKPLTYEQVKRLVRENNRSKLPDEMIVAIIFKESSFDPSVRSKDPQSSETGLMQINRRAWKALHIEGLKRPESELPDFRHAYDPATNIQRGSAYLQLRIEQLGGNLERALASYGTGTPQYAADVIAATKALQENPDNPVAALSKAYRRKYP